MKPWITACIFPRRSDESPAFSGTPRGNGCALRVPERARTQRINKVERFMMGVFAEQCEVQRVSCQEKWHGGDQARFPLPFAKTAHSGRGRTNAAVGSRRKANSKRQAPVGSRP